NPDVYISCIKQFWNTAVVKRSGDVTRRLKKVGTSQRVESSEDEENVFNQRRISVDMDQDEGVAAASAPIPAAKPKVLKIVAALVTRKRKGVIIRDPEEELHVDTPAETPTVKDKGKGFKMEFFKGKTYDQILPIFQARFDANMKFLFKSREEMEKQDKEIIKSINETHAQKAAKRRKLSEEAQKVDNLRGRLEIVPDEDDDVFVEAISLAQKVPVVDYQTMFGELDEQDPIWRNQKSVHGLALVKRWKLLTSCGVHVNILSTVQLFLLVERRYPLSRFTLEQLVNVARLQAKVKAVQDAAAVGHAKVPGIAGEGGGVVVRVMGYGGVEQKIRKMGSYRLAGIKVNIKNDKVSWKCKLSNLNEDISCDSIGRANCTVSKFQSHLGWNKVRGFGFWTRGGGTLIVYSARSGSVSNSSKSTRVVMALSLPFGLATVLPGRDPDPEVEAVFICKRLAIMFLISLV
nr:hypothetical protein [Tanacetum cinerariifolium]